MYSISISLAYEKWTEDIVTNSDSFKALLQSVFASDKRAAFPDFFVSGMEAAYNSGYLGGMMEDAAAASADNSNSSSNSSNSSNSSSNSTDSSQSNSPTSNSNTSAPTSAPTWSAADYMSLYYQNSSSNITYNGSASGFRVSDSELVIYVHQFPVYALPPYGVEQVIDCAEWLN